MNTKDFNLINEKEEKKKRNDSFSKRKTNSKEIPESDIKIFANHSPYKNKVLKHIFFGRKFCSGRKVKRISGKDRKIKHGIVKKSFSHIKNAKFPIVLVKPVSKEDLKDVNGEVEYNINTNDAVLKEELMGEKDKELELKEIDGHEDHSDVGVMEDQQKCSYNSEPNNDLGSKIHSSNNSIVLPEPLNNKVHRKRGRKSKKELAQIATHFKKLKIFDYDENLESEKNDNFVNNFSRSNDIKDNYNVESETKYVERSDNPVQNTSESEVVEEKENILNNETGSRENFVADDTFEAGISSSPEEIPVLKTRKRSKLSLTEVIKTIYKCSFCKYESKIRAHAREHSLTHANFRLFKCSECDFRTNRKDKILLHLTKVHKLNPSYVSKYNYITTQDVEVAKEISFCQTVTEETVTAYKCSVCGYLTEDKSDAEKHQEIHSEIDYDLNGECSNEIPVVHRRKNNGMFDRFYKTIKKFEIKTDGGLRRTSIFKCSICNYQTIKIDRAKRHSLTHSKTKVFQCQKCDFNTNRSEKMRSHLQRIHEIESTRVSRRRKIKKNFLHNVFPNYPQPVSDTAREIFRCCFCDFKTEFKFESQNHFANHFNSELDGGELESSELGRINDMKNSFQINKYNNSKYNEVMERCYDTIDEVEITTDSCTENTGGKKIVFRCSICSLETDTKARAKRHSLNHAKTKLFHCQICDYGCNRKDKMKIHESKHEIEGKTIRRGRKKGYKVATSQNSELDIPVKAQNSEFEEKVQNSELNAKIENFKVDVSFEIENSEFDASNYSLKTDESHPSPHYMFDNDDFLDSDCFDANDESFMDNLIPDLNSEFNVFEDILKDPLDTNDVPTTDNSVDTPKSGYSFAQLLKYAEYDYQSYKESEIPSTSEIVDHLYDDRYLYRSEDKLFLCIECTFQTEKMESMKSHLESHVINSNVLKCSRCSFETTSANIFSRHEDSCSLDCLSDKSLPKRQIYQCPKCSCQFKYKKVWTKHLQKHFDSLAKNPNTTFHCSDCSFKTSLKEEMTKHSVVHKSKMFKCSTCSYQTKYKFALLKHSPACLKNLKRQLEAVAILPENQLPSENIFDFPEFDEKDDALLNSNMRILKCDKCTFQTYLRSKLKKHLQIHSNELVEQVDCSCETCANNNNNNNNNNQERALSVDSSATNSHSALIAGSVDLSATNSQIALSAGSDDLSATNSQSDLSADSSATNSQCSIGSVHSSATELFKCSICTYVTHVQSYLEIHEQIHTDFFWEENK